MLSVFLVRSAGLVFGSVESTSLATNSPSLPGTVVQTLACHQVTSLVINSAPLLPRPLYARMPVALRSSCHLSAQLISKGLNTSCINRDGKDVMLVRFDVSSRLGHS